MSDHSAREDLAFIRAMLQEGRAYASFRAPDMIVWGIAIATGYLGTYFICAQPPAVLDGLWVACIAPSK